MTFDVGCAARTTRGLALALGLALAAGVAPAEPKSQDAAVQQVLRKAQAMLRDLTQRNAALEAEKAALLDRVKQLETANGQLETAVRRLEPLQGEVERRKAAASALEASRAGLESQLTAGHEREQVLRQKLKEIAEQAGRIRDDNQLLVAAVREREQWIGQCGERNRSLLEANRELLEKYRDKGFWDQLAENEPFTGLGRVEAENAAEDYRYRLHQLRVTPFEAAPVPPAEAAPAARDDDEEDR
jgi:chromosome segregation ATPase